MENPDNTQYDNIYKQIPIVDNHLLLSILTTIFCCLPVGAISIVYSVQTNLALYTHNYELAKIYYNKAKFWGILALGLCITLWGICILGYIIFHLIII